MDIYNIMKKIQEIEYLKMILLNEKQIRFFNLLKNPILIVPKEETESNLKKTTEEAIQFYQNKANFQSFSEIDLRILDLIQK